MEKINAIKNEGMNSDLVEITLNSDGDTTYISASDDSFLEKFAVSYDKVCNLADQFEKDAAEYAKFKKTDDSDGRKREIEMIRKKRVFSDEISKITDDLFGEGTVRKLFKESFNLIPDFAPSVEKTIVFYENIKPDLEKIFGKKIKTRQDESKARMDRFQPQDHKRPASKK